MTLARRRTALTSMTLLFAAASSLACKKSEDGMAHMPAASGPGAAPRPELPKLDLVDTSDDGVVAGGTGETTGTTFPRQEAYIGPKVTGTIAAVLVDEGSRVKKGDVLFRLDSGDMRLRVDQAAAALKSAQVGESATKVELDRFQRLFEQKAVDQAQWDRVRAQYDGALAGVGQARVGVDMAHKALAEGGKLPPKRYERVPENNPHKEWMAAIRANKPTHAGSNFEYSVPFTEMVCLGTMAIQVGKKLTWDSAAMKTNLPEADKLLYPTYRKGWNPGETIA